MCITSASGRSRFLLAKKGSVADVIGRREVGGDDQCNLLCTTVVVARRTFVGLISMGYGWMDGRGNDIISEREILVFFFRRLSSLALFTPGVSEVGDTRLVVRLRVCFFPV